MEVIYVEVGLNRATETRHLHNTIVVIKSSNECRCWNNNKQFHREQFSFVVSLIFKLTMVNGGRGSG